MTKLRRVTRDRHLTPEEADKYNTIRQQVENDLPQLLASHEKNEVALEMIKQPQFW